MLPMIANMPLSNRGFTPAAPSYSHPLSSGARLAGIRSTYAATTGTTNGNSMITIVDGLSTTGIGWATAATDGIFLFDFGNGHSYIVNEIRLTWTAATTHGTWLVEGSPDGSGWTALGSGFTLGGATTQTITTPSANTTGYRFYRLRQTAGSTQSGNALREVEFSIADAIDGMTSIAHAQSRGDRTALITASTTYTPHAVDPGTINNIVDGSYLVGSTAILAGSAWRPAASQTVGNFKFDFGSPVIMDKMGMTWSQGFPGWNATWAGSNDDSAYTDLFTNSTMHHGFGWQSLSWANSTAYRYYRATRTAGMFDVYLIEWEFSLRTPSP